MRKEKQDIQKPAFFVSKSNIEESKNQDKNFQQKKPPLSYLNKKEYILMHNATDEAKRSLIKFRDHVINNPEYLEKAINHLRAQAINSLDKMSQAIQDFSACKVDSKEERASKEHIEEDYIRQYKLMKQDKI